MEEFHYDIIITGGGPAGSTCGIFLKKWNPGLRVCILDKKLFPRNKTCGDGISPQVVDIILNAGIHDFFQDKLAISSFKLSINLTRELEYDMRNLSENRSEGYVYERELFDDKLLHYAADAGVHVFERHEIMDIQEVGECLTRLDGRCPSGNFSVTGRAIVCADGAHSMWRRHLGVPANSDRHTGVGLRYYCHTPPLKDIAIRIDLLARLKNSYGWFFPVGRDLANVGIGVDARICRQRKLNLNKEFMSYLDFLGRKVEIKTIASTKAGFMLPFASQMPPLVHDNKVLIGDAASMINPLTGEGIYYGMSAGRLLARHLADGLKISLPIKDCLAAFAKEFNELFHKHYRFNYHVKKFLGSPLSGLFLKSVLRDKVLMDKAVRNILHNTGNVGMLHCALSIIKHSSRHMYEQFKKNVSG